MGLSTLTLRVGSPFFCVVGLDGNKPGISDPYYRV